MYRFLSHSSLLVFILFFSIQSQAGSFRAMPLRLYLDSESKTEVLKVVNEGSEKVTVQIDAKGWSHDVAGKAVHSETADLIVFPKMATIQAGETQVIRVGYTGAPSDREKTYRLFVQELPVNKPGQMALKFAITLSLPVFVAPDKEVVDWSAQPAGMAKGSLRVKVNNSGNRHVLVKKIMATGHDRSGTEVFAAEAAGWYTLAGESRLYPVAIPYQDCLKASRINLQVQTKTESKQLDIPVEEAMCTRKPEVKNRASASYPTGRGTKK